MRSLSGPGAGRVIAALAVSASSLALLPALAAPAAAAACSGPVTPIGSVQGGGDASPMAGTTVTVRGVVVGDHEGASPALRGFYLQDSGDGDPATSDGLFAFNGSLNSVALGDLVEVTGSVAEFQAQTQISVASVTSCGRADVPTTDVTLPVASATHLERYEGMLVTLPQELSVTEHFLLGRFGEVVVSSGGRLRQPTAVTSPGEPARALAAANALNRLKIDDASQAQNADPVFGRDGQPLSAANTLRGGDTVTGATGVLTYTWGGNSASPNAYRLRPVSALGGAAEFEAVNERPAEAPEVGGDVTVAGANLLNFFNTFGRTSCTFGVGGATAECRGAENTTELDRQVAKEVAAILRLDADVVSYMEMENDGYGPNSAVAYLVDKLNEAAGAGTWAFVNPDLSAGTNAAGTDAIKSGFLYQPASVQPVLGALADTAGGALWDRVPVAQAFVPASGGRFTVVANHFKSKGSCPSSGADADQGDGQGCWNDRRTQQAERLATWIDESVVPTVGDADVLITGDLNSYAQEDPIVALEKAGYTDLAAHFQGDDAYSYVFDGQWGYLDYALASPSMLTQVTGAAEDHINADEPSVLDYNTNFKSASQQTRLYAPDEFRTSDHDPVLVGISLDTTPPTIEWSGGVEDGDSWVYGEEADEPTCVARDEESGPGACAVTGWSEEVGEHVLVATATDLAGNRTEETRRYTVAAWTLEGFAAPVSLTEDNLRRGGSTVPLKWQAFAGETEVVAVDSVRSVVTAPCDGGAATLAVGTTTRADGQYLFEWKTPRTAGCQVLTMTMADGTSLSARFQLR